MPTIPLAAGLGIRVDGSLAPGASLRSLLPDFDNLTALTLAALPRSFVSAGFEVTRDVTLAPDFGFQLTGGATATLTVIRDAGRAIDESDPFPAIVLAAGEICLAFTLRASLQPGVPFDAGSTAFGFNKGVSHQWTIYRSFPSTAPLGASFARLLDEFILPTASAELAALPPGVVLLASGSGSITVSAATSLSLAVTPLANLSLPAGRRLTLSPELALTLEPSFTLEGSYRVRLRPLNTGEVELGVSQGPSTTLTLSLNARAALPVQLGNFDLTAQLIRGLSADPSIVSRQQLLAALPGDGTEFDQQRRLEQLEEQLRRAVNRRLEASARLALSRLQASTHLFLYALNPAANSASEALTGALHGNFNALLANPPGVRRLSSALTTALSTSTRLHLNLLGLANFTSSAELVLSSEIHFNNQDQLTLITDTASVSRATALLRNFGGNTRRLQHLCTESFLVRAAYQASGLAILPPSATARHTYLEVHHATSRREWRNNLQALLALGLLAPGDAANLLAPPEPLGHSTLYLEAAYDDSGVAALLFDHGQPRSLDAFQQAGRTALHALIDGDENRTLTCRFTSLTAAGQATWNAIAATGPNGIAQVLGVSLLDAGQRLALETARADFLAINWWATAAHHAALAAAHARQLLNGETVSSSHPRFHTARHHLQQRLSHLAQYTGDHFGDPLGLLMMHVASGHSGKLGAILTSNVTGRRLFGTLQQPATGV